MFLKNFAQQPNQTSTNLMRKVFKISKKIINQPVFAENNMHWNQ